MPLKVREVIVFHIDSMREFGLPIPPRHTAVVVEVDVEASVVA